MGNSQDPITLHKYLYANADPANTIDPSGNFGLAEFGTASNIRGILATRSVPSFSSMISQAIGGALRLSGRATTKAGLRVLRKCIRQRNRCGLRAHLLIVGYDNPAMKDHIRSAQMASTVVLTYKRNQTGNRQWYRRMPECRVIRPGYQCDEYPFFKTKEGGLRNYLKQIVSLRQVPARENMSVGGHFGFLARSMNRSREKDFVVVTSDSLPTVAIPSGGR